MPSRQVPYSALVLGSALVCAVVWFDVWTIGSLFRPGRLEFELFAFTVIPNLGVSSAAVLMIRGSWRMTRSLGGRRRVLAFFGIGGFSALAVAGIMTWLFLWDLRHVGPLIFAIGAFGVVAILRQTKRQVADGDLGLT